MKKNLNEILNHYLACALWTGELDGRNQSEISNNSVEIAMQDIKSFVEKAGDLLNDLTEEQIGHDFWLTRGHQGAGFWDRDLGETGDKLTEITQEFKTLNVFDEGEKIIIE